MWRRQRVDEDVAQDATAEGRDHAKCQHPDDVKLCCFQACDRAVERTAWIEVVATGAIG